MSDPFAAYGARATSTATPRLVGIIKTRAEAKQRYVEIVNALNNVKSAASLEQYLFGIRHELAQFEAELEYFWKGDSDFAGLQREIERTQVRLDDGLDYPRYEVN